MRRNVIRLVLLGFAAGLTVTVGVAFAGGWTSTTVHPLAAAPVAGKPFRVTFTVRQHGHRPVRVEDAAIEIANSDGALKRFAARPLARTGRYTADVVFPDPGVWQWRALPGPFPPQSLGAITVREADGKESTPLDGRNLFLRKGCAGCHMGPDDRGFVQAGPRLDDLAERFGKNGLAYVRQSILAPRAVVVPGGGLSGGPVAMPKLEVGQAEATAIARYLLKPRRS
ncbi:MAG: c-type cytochrome [Gaiella sp.]